MPNILEQKPINSLIAKFSVPAVISMLVGALYNVVDQIFIGNGVSDIAIGATTVAFPIVTVCMAFSLLCGVGGASNFNIDSGRGEYGRARHAAGTSLFLLFTGGVVIMLGVLAFLAPILRLCGATGRLMNYSLTYAGITAYGLPFLTLAAGGSHLIRADKNPFYSMATNLSGALLNTVLDPLFIFVFKWDIAGAAWATVIGQALSALMVALYFARLQKMNLKRQDLRPTLRRACRVASLGSSSGLNQLALLIVQVLMNNQLAKYGALSVYGAESAVTCAGVVAKVSMIFMSITIGVSQGCQPIWGFNYGAKNYGRVRETYRKAFIICLSAGVLFFLIFQMLPTVIIRMFGIRAETDIDFASRYFRVFMFMIFINGLQPMTAGFFTSIGKAKLGIIISLTRQIVIFAPLALILPLWRGIDGILYTGPIADGIAAVIAVSLAANEIKKIDRLSKTTASVF